MSPLLCRWVFVLPLKVLMSATSYMERKWVKGPHYFKWGLTEPNKEHKTEQLSQTIAPRHLKQGWELNYSPLLSELSPALLRFPCLLVSARWTRHWQRSIFSAEVFWLVIPISTASADSSVLTNTRRKTTEGEVSFPLWWCCKMAKVSQLQGKKQYVVMQCSCKKVMTWACNTSWIHAHIHISKQFIHIAWLHFFVNFYLLLFRLLPLTRFLPFIQGRKWTNRWFHNVFMILLVKNQGELDSNCALATVA